MDLTALLVGLVIGALVGGLLAWLSARSALLARSAGAEAERDVLRERVADLESARDVDDTTATLLAPCATPSAGSSARSARSSATGRSSSASSASASPR